MPVRYHSFRAGGDRYVPVDLEIWGCPLNKYQLLEAVVALLQQRRPNLPTHSVCLDCKRKGIVCVMVAQGVPCLGPATQAGCNALCPTYGRGCYGCFGPVATPNPTSLGNQFIELGMDQAGVSRAFRSFNGYMSAFRVASDHARKFSFTRFNVSIFSLHL